ncbi:alkaline phosphatase family protein [Sphingorhabdus arenilitoris]|uniref:Alkaline phosphatase n=1 Tax=Sphingorhabdus arenilitoris TaxID=1490041 RepID=A0ABV8REA4_9SPHN
MTANIFRSSLSVIALLCAAPMPVTAQTVVYQAGAPIADAAPPADNAPPKLIVAISVDQFSADLFAEYRREFTGGLQRLQEGAVFPSGYQAQSATETCPGHSTILTGVYPARSGIIANDWIDLNTGREDKGIYCAEDESVPGSNSDKYTVSDVHLLVPTLGERMKKANAASRVVSVAGKDRAAVMMGGHDVDELWWWDNDSKKFTSYAGRAVPPAVRKVNSQVQTAIASATSDEKLPGFCQAHSRAVAIDDGKTVGTGRFARAAGDARGFRASPYSDMALFGLATGLVADMKLGQGEATDLIAIGASATDYVGHTYGTSGSEMCLNLLVLDNTLEVFFRALDEQGTDYAVVLTADHGGHDLPERLRSHAVPEAQRITASIAPEVMGAAIASKLKLARQPLNSRGVGDVWIDKDLDAKTKARVLDEALAAYRAHPMVAAAFSRAELLATKVPAAGTPPESWSLIERARATFHPDRSGDFYVALKPRITPIPDTKRGTVATHGSIWDYDRRVPILFWRSGMARFEQPLSVSTVDIAPTLAALIKLPVETNAFDGRCLDLDASEGTSCE